MLISGGQIVWLICEICQKEQKSAKLRVDPYQQDLYDKTVHRVLCDQCTKDLCDEI
jgi:hypothetical protein